VYAPADAEPPHPTVDVAGRPEFGGRGSQPGNLVRPTDIETDTEGNLYVIDQARRMLNDLDTFRVSVGLPAEDEDVAAHRWVAEVFEPITGMVPADLRGPFRPIASAVPGMDFCEHFPKLAQQAKQVAILRSMTSPLGEHGIANHYLLTGYKPSSALEYPSYGAVVSSIQKPGGLLPPYIAVPDYRPTSGPGYLGSAHAPFATGGDPAKPDFQVRDLDLFPKVTASRVRRRREYLDLFDNVQKQVEAGKPADPAFEKAFRMTVSPEAKQAFDLSRETLQTRQRYGPRTIGQSCLLARRLVERGVPFVTVLNTGWDTHDSLVLQLRDGYSGAKQGVGLIPSLDLALAGLIGDLAERAVFGDGF